MSEYVSELALILLPSFINFQSGQHMQVSIFFLTFKWNLTCCNVPTRLFSMVLYIGLTHTSLPPTNVHWYIKHSICCPAITGAIRGTSKEEIFEELVLQSLQNFERPISKISFLI